MSAPHALIINSSSSSSDHHHHHHQHQRIIIIIIIITIIHLSIHFLHMLVRIRFAGVSWSLSQLSGGERQGYTLDRWSVYRRANTQRQTDPHTHAYGQLRLITSPIKHVFELWEEAGVPGENTQGEHTNSTHTVLTTAPIPVFPSAGNCHQSQPY